MVKFLIVHGLVITEFLSLRFSFCSVWVWPVWLLFEKGFNILWLRNGVVNSRSKVKLGIF